MMQLKRRVVDEAIQIRFFECDLNIVHRSDNPIDHFLWGFWSLDFRQSLRFVLQIASACDVSLEARNPSMIA
jgi:hypothetical protein